MYTDASIVQIDLSPKFSRRSARTSVCSVFRFILSFLLSLCFAPEASAQNWNMDLTSKWSGITFAKLPHPVTIAIYGAHIPGSTIPVATYMHVSSSTRLTAAEAIAVQQVLNGEHQTLLVSPSGVAVGGRFNLATDVLPGDGHMGLVIPKNVIALDNVSKTASVTVPYALINYGRIYLYSSDKGVTSGSIFSTDFIQNYGTISSQLPSALARVWHAAPQVNVTLGVTDGMQWNPLAIGNNGRIYSSGNLDLFAGIAGITNQMPDTKPGVGIIGAAQNVVFDSGFVHNLGHIYSSNANIFFTTQNSTGIQVDTENGTLQYKHGFLSLYAPSTTIPNSSGIAANFLLSPVYIDAGQGYTWGGFSFWGSLAGTVPPVLPICDKQSSNEQDIVVDTGD